MTARRCEHRWEPSINSSTDNKNDTVESSGSESTSADSWTIKKLLDWTTDFFTKHEFESARLEAEVLLAEALNCKRIDLYTRFNEIPGEPDLGRFRGWVKRHAKGEPVAYLVGHREFFSLGFKVDSNVLIPRPETEHLVLEAIEAAKQFSDRPIRIADVGTGSGCIAVTLATQVADCIVSAVDISPDALAIAQENATAHSVEDRVSFSESDLMVSLAESEPFHIIVSNPPYVGENEEGTLDQNVRQFEPAIALFGGPQGTEIIARLVNEAAEKLVSCGFLIFETSPIIMDECMQLVEASSHFAESKSIKDYSGHPRVVVARRK